MLVLSRREGESLILTVDGERISVKVLWITRDKIRLGIDASHRVTCHRLEVQQRIDEGELA